MQDIIDKYIETNGITFRLQAVNEDGDVLVQQTSGQSFDDVSASSWQLDQAFHKMAMEAEEAKNDDIIDAEVIDTLDVRTY